jgi:hypothetical protein
MMNRENIEQEILRHARQSSDTPISFHPSSIEGVPAEKVHEVLESMHGQGTLGMWTVEFNGRHKSFDEYTSPSDFFNFVGERGYIRVAVIPSQAPTPIPTIPLAPERPS